jgi:hypothetical protein
VNKDQLKQSLRQPYKRQQWLELLRSVVPSCEVFADAQPISVELDGAKIVHQLGRVSLAGGRTLAVLEVKLDPKKNVVRNRVGLRNLVARFIDQAQHHGVLAVFVSDRTEYRLSLAVRESVFDQDGQLVHRETAPRRYTYVLGPNEPCTTSAERFASLAAKGEQATLEDVIDAFSVEKLNKEFFTKYREHYQRFVAHLLAGDVPQTVFGVPSKFEDEEARDRALKPVRDFAKKLLGRLVFLHFLQKKGWLGCPADQKTWTKGDPAFLKSLFDGCKNQEHFYSQRLAPLFFDALNKANRENNLFKPTGTRIPYLNGGLFEDDLHAARKLDFPAALFGDLLGFFGEYNFTIDENDPDDHEVGIDPEMLGHVFENLLEDNKDKGAYYTPKAIVQYMCQQSLIHYLQAHLGTHPEIETLVREKNRGDDNDKKNWVKQNAKEIERLLDEVKICDPAIGSGAFPIGLLQEIYWIKLTLDWTLDRAATKRRIIQNSIYGVDIDAGAVEIARLRFWLALIVDEDQPSPLPNLDYKIMQGDSLLESFEGIRLDQLFQQNYALNVIGGQAELNLDSLGTQLTLVNQKQRDKLTALTGSYFTEADPTAKLELHKKIDRLVLEHIEHSIAVQKEMFEVELAQHRVNIADKQQRAKGWKPPLRAVKRMAQLEADIKLCVQRGQKLKGLEGKPERPYFLWHVYFQDVFERGGFDIVIANPPYVRHETISAYRKLLEPHYSTAGSRADLFVFFYEQGVRLLRPRGVLTFISSNKYYRSAYGEKLREYLAANLTLREMVDFGDAPVFEAIAYASILIGQKDSPPAEHNFPGYSWQPTDRLDRLSQVMTVQTAPIKQAALTSSGWNLSTPAVAQLFQKLRANGSPLNDYAGVRFYRGIITGLNEAFVINAETRQKLIAQDAKSADLIKPWLRGRDVKRWQTTWAGLYVIAFPFGFHEQIKNYPAVLKHLSQYETDLRKRGQCTSSRSGKGEGQHHWLELDNNPKPSYLAEFSQPKVLMPAFERQATFAYDNQGFYSNNKTSICVSDDAQFLCAVLNSAPLWWTLRQTAATRQNGYFEYLPMYLSALPIPRADVSSKQALTRLAERAAKSAGAELAAIEREINQLVYGLFELSATEIAIIEDSTATAPVLDVKTTLFTRVLPGLGAISTYFSFANIVARLKELSIALSENTLRDYLSDAMKTGVVHDAGRGWYSRLVVPFELEAKPVSNLVKLVKKEFPLLEYSCWSTAQINAYAQHLLSQHTAFLFADVDALESVAERLRDRGWQPLVDPNAMEAQKLFRPGDKTVVLRPALAKQPDSGDHYAPIEKLLVDLLVEAPKLKLMDDSEVQRVIENACSAGRIQASALVGYAKSRRVSIQFLQESINSAGSENADLMD